MTDYQLHPGTPPTVLPITSTTPAQLLAAISALPFRRRRPAPDPEQAA